jgi:hypothetical protein
MDNKGVFNKPRKIRLAGDDLVVVTSALRLSGVDVVINHTALSDWNRSQP